MSQQEESQSTPALVQASDGDCGDATSSLSSIPENNLLESYTRLSISLEDNGLFKVHERQAARMKTRSEWFLSPSIYSPMTSIEAEDLHTPYYILRDERTGNLYSTTVQGAQMTSSQESLKHPIVRRSSSKEKDRYRLVRRSSSKKNKENGTTTCSSVTNPTNTNSSNNASGSSNNNKRYGSESESIAQPPASPTTPTSLPVSPAPENSPAKSEINQEDIPMVSESDCTETDVQTFHVTLTYKPRI